MVFKVKDALRFGDEPDLSSYGLRKLIIIYEDEFRFTDAGGQPEIDYIKDVTIPKYKNLYPTLTELALKATTWSLYDTSTGPIATNIQYHLDVIQAFRDDWSTIEVGFLGEIPIRKLSHLTGTVDENTERQAAWEDQNDLLMPIVDAVDFLIPDVQAIGISAANDSIYEDYFLSNIQEADRLTGNRTGGAIPIRPVFWVNPDSLPNHTDDYSYSRWYDRMQMAFDNTDAMIIWSKAGSTPAFDFSRPWWKATQQFITDNGITL